MSNGTFLYPNVTSLPADNRGIDSESRLNKGKGAGVEGEFAQLFEKTVTETALQSDLDQVRAPLKFSAHASQRLKDRKIALDPMTLAKVIMAVDKTEAKGVDDTLILTPDVALIVNVKNRTVITAMDRNSLSGNVFTNIDGAVII